MITKPAQTVFHNKEEAHTFWDLIRKAADYDRRATENQRYYEAGYCGGCSTCGSPPHELSLDELAEIVTGFRRLFSIEEEQP